MRRGRGELVVVAVTDKVLPCLACSRNSRSTFSQVFSVHKRARASIFKAQPELLTIHQSEYPFNNARRLVGCLPTEVMSRTSELGLLLYCLKSTCRPSHILGGCDCPGPVCQWNHQDVLEFLLSWIHWHSKCLQFKILYSSIYLVSLVCSFNWTIRNATVFIDFA